MQCDETNSDDAVLVRRSLQGEGVAFGHLFERYYDRVRAHAYRMVLDTHVADDVAQEAFIRAAKGLAELRESHAFGAWLFQIAGNLSKDKIRAQTAYAARIESYAREWSTGQADPEDASHGDAARVRAAVAKLPLKQREAVSLVWFDERTHAEAAAAIGCAESTVSWRLSLAKRKLRTLLAP